jgi:hypothetical protein
LLTEALLCFGPSLRRLRLQRLMPWIKRTLALVVGFIFFGCHLVVGLWRGWTTTVVERYGHVRVSGHSRTARSKRILSPALALSALGLAAAITFVPFFIG